MVVCRRAVSGSLGTSNIGSAVNQHPDSSGDATADLLIHSVSAVREAREKELQLKMWN